MTKSHRFNSKLALESGDHAMDVDMMSPLMDVVMQCIISGWGEDEHPAAIIGCMNIKSPTSQVPGLGACWNGDDKVGKVVYIANLVQCVLDCNLECDVGWTGMVDIACTYIGWNYCCSCMVGLLHRAVAWYVARFATDEALALELGVVGCHIGG